MYDNSATHIMKLIIYFPCADLIFDLSTFRTEVKLLQWSINDQICERRRKIKIWNFYWELRRSNSRRQTTLVLCFVPIIFLAYKSKPERSILLQFFKVSFFFLRLCFYFVIIKLGSLYTHFGFAFGILLRQDKGKLRLILEFGQRRSRGFAPSSVQPVYIGET